MKNIQEYVRVIMNSVFVALIKYKLKRIFVAIINVPL